MWRRPTESGISFICILAPTRFFVKSIKINIARRGLKISSPASFSSPLSSFARAKLASIPSSQLRQTRFLQTKKKRPSGRFFISLPKIQLSQQAKHILTRLIRTRAKNSSARKFPQPATKFLAGKNLLQFLPHRLRQIRLLQKKMRPSGRIFYHSTKPYF